MKSGLKPANIIGLIAAVTMIPLITLMWLGWRLLDQDRLLEEQQIQDRVERAADLIVTEIERAISDSERRLASDAGDWPEGALGVVFRDGHVEAYPRSRSAFVPVPEALPGAPASEFSEGERFEFQLNAPSRAIDTFRRMANSDDPALRAGALMRLGRNLRKAQQVEDALSVYAELSELDGVLVGGVPAGLAGRFARLEILESEGRQEDLEEEAAQLSGELRNARWPLTAAVYRLYLEDADRWHGFDESGRTEGELFGEALEHMWAIRDGVTTSRRETIAIGEEALTVLWEVDNDETRALIATRAFVESHWLEAAFLLAKKQGVSFTLRDTESRTLFGVASTDGRPDTNRLAQVTSLPWTLSATSLAAAGEDPAFARRRQLLIAGFVLVASMALTASYLIVRGVNRERELASMQSEFVNAVSHEFRTPLTALRQFTDMLRENLRLDDERRRVCYEALGSATDRLEKLVESLLDFGRMEAGARTYRLESIDCTRDVQNAVDAFRLEAEASGHAVRFESNGAVMIEADADALAHALHNLLDNALKYSPGRSEIRVSVVPRSEEVRISVQDDGIGIPAAEREAIFTKFQRGEQARQRGIRGTGIGLAMVDDIVRAHGGRLEVDSEVGRGSTFTIVLPRKAREG